MTNARFLKAAAALFLSWSLFSLHGQAQPPPAGQEPAQTPPEGAKPDTAKLEDKVPDAKGLDPKAPVAPVDPRTYKIGVEDVLSVQVWRERELSGLYTVRPDGKISMPLGGEIEAEGASPDEFKTRVVAALSNFMVNPEVLVGVAAVMSKKYHITGEVMRTGPFSLVRPTTVLEALSNAGGFRDFANLKKIQIMRGEERLKFNYKDVVKGKHMEQNILLQPGDHIIVP